MIVAVKSLSVSGVRFKYCLPARLLEMACLRVRSGENGYSWLRSSRSSRRLSLESFGIESDDDLGIVHTVDEDLWTEVSAPSSRIHTRVWASKEMHLRVCDNPVAHHLHGQES